MQEFPIKAIIKSLLVAVPILVLLSIASCGLKVVDTGNRGVETRFGKVVSESLPEGLYFFNPFTSNIVELDVRESKMEAETMGYTKDVQNVRVIYAINFMPDATQMHVLYEKIGRDWAAKMIPQVLLGKVKQVIGQYEAVKLVSERQLATAAMFDTIKEELAAKGVIVKNFEITNLDFNDPFENAVEAKVVAIQEAEEAKNKTVRVREEADQKIISAKAEAESMRIRAQALTQNKSLVEYEAVQRWDGKLPHMMTGNTIPFLNVTK